MGGNRRGTAKTYRNLFIIFFLTGLWHGASFNFIIWGLWHGFFLVLERWKLGKVLEKIPAVFLHGYTLLVIMIGWVFFRAETLPDAWQYCCQLVNITAWNFSKVFVNINGELLTVICLGILFCTPFPFQWISNVTKSGNAARICRIVYLGVLLAGFWGAICYMTGSGFNPFIYFRF